MSTTVRKSQRHGRRTGPSPRLGHALLAGGLAGAGSAVAWSARHLLPGGRRWERTNHAGEPVTMREGPVWAIGACLGLALAPGLSGRQRLAALTATGLAATFGAIDDLAETGSSKGLRGHLGALRKGEVTTGALKILGISGAGLLAAALLDPLDRHGPRSLPGRTVSIVVAGGVIAGTANLVNLLDLRPGRALKVALLPTAAVLAGGPVAVTQAVVSGASVSLLPPDLGEVSMLGDSGANAVGALLGLTFVLATADRPHPVRARALALAVLLALTVASEKVSFTRVIESTPGLRELDALGRRPRRG